MSRGPRRTAEDGANRSRLSAHLARRESLSTIFTIDHNDFETYRIEGRRRFRVVPGRSVTVNP